MSIVTLNRVKKRHFDRGSVCVFGQRGSGKDMLLGNVAVRNEQHISNVDYGSGHIPLDFDMLDIKNKPTDLVSGNVTPYVYPYPEKVDIFISDIGIYFPAQYCDFLNKKYPSLPMFLALSRQLGLANVHINSQALNRAWDKFREQSDTYILCRGCRVFHNLVVLNVTIYDTYETALTRARPFWYPKCRMFASRDEKALYRNNQLMAYQKYLETHGNVKDYTLVFFNKSNYDTRYFKQLLGGVSHQTFSP